MIFCEKGGGFGEKRRFTLPFREFACESGGLNDESGGLNRGNGGLDSQIEAYAEAKGAACDDLLQKRQWIW